MDGLTLRAVATQANRRCAGARIDGLRWVAPAALRLDFSRRAPALLLSASPHVAGLFGAPPEVSRVGHPTLLGHLRRHLVGGTLRGVSTPGLERVVFLEVEKVSAAGRARRFTLILEAMSRWSNLVLAEGPERIVLVAFRVFPGGEGRRTVAPGLPWTPPPAGDRPDPAGLAADELETRLAGGRTPAAVAAALAGLSPETAGELLEAAGEGSPAGILRHLIEEPPAEASLAADGRGRFRLALGMRPGPGRVDVLEASAELYRREVERLGTRTVSGDLARDLGRRRKQLETLHGRLRGELDEAGRADEYQAQGALLMSHLGEIARGDERFVTDHPYGQDGERVEVPLDPKLSPPGNAERLFRQARKMRARAALLGGRLAKVEQDLERVAKLLGILASETDPARLGELEASIHAFLRQRERPAAGGGDVAPAVRRAPRRYLEYVSSGGWRLIVGKDAASNDHILSRVATPGDLWCHAEGFAGAHVILKGFGAREIPPEAALIEACMLAAHHSQGRREGKVTVSYTRRKYVHKPKGAAPGLVILKERRTMTVPPEIPPGVRLTKGG